MSESEPFGAWLAGLLGDLDMSQSDLWRAIGVSSAAVSRWLNGEDRPGPANCRKIARALSQRGRRISEEEVLRRAGHLSGRPVERAAERPPLSVRLAEVLAELRALEQRDEGTGQAGTIAPPAGGKVGSSQDVLLSTSDYARVPIVSVRSGAEVSRALLAEGNGGVVPVDLTFVPRSRMRGAGGAVGLLAADGCLSPWVRDGETGLVERTDELRPGDVGIVLLGERLLVGRVRAGVGGGLVIGPGDDGNGPAVALAEATVLGLLLGRVEWFGGPG